MNDQQEAELVAGLKNQHGISAVYRLEVDGNAAYFRAPSIGVWRRFQDQSRAGKGPTAGENLVRGSLLHPPAEEFDAMLEDRPGLIASFFGELIKVAGATDSVEKKVL